MTDQNTPNNLHDPFDTESAPLSKDSLGLTDEMTAAYRTRGWVMPLVGILTSLLFAVLVPCWCKVWADLEEPMALIVLGVLPMLLAIPFHVLGGNQKRLRSAKMLRTAFYCLGILLNIVGTSLCMTAYYVHLTSKPTASALFAGALASIALYVIMALLMQIWPNRYALLTGLVALVSVALIIVSIVFWVRSDNKLFFSFAFFNLLWTLISVITLHVACSDEESPCLRFASFASFGLLMAVAAIVLVILACAGGDCDCDCSDGCCDCGDCGCGDGGNGKSRVSKRNRKKTL